MPLSFVPNYPNLRRNQCNQCILVTHNGFISLIGTSSFKMTANALECSGVLFGRIAGNVESEYAATQ